MNLKMTKIETGKFEGTADRQSNYFQNEMLPRQASHHAETAMLIWPRVPKYNKNKNFGLIKFGQKFSDKEILD